MSDDTTAILRSYIQESFSVPEERMPGGGESLLVSGVLDSMSVMDLVEFLQQRFGISIADEEVLPENFETLDALAAFVGGKISRSPS